MSALAEMERELIVERTRAGLAAAREQGRIGGRQYAPALLLLPDLRGCAPQSARVPSPQGRSFPITWLSGDIFSQAQAQIMGLDEFSGAAKI